MAALTKERKIRQFGESPNPKTIVIPVAASTKIYAGAIVCDNGSGYATKGVTGTGLITLGVAEETVDNTGSAGDKSIRVRRGAFYFNNSGTNAVALASRGDTLYVEDDNTVGTSATGTSACGKCLDYSATDGVLVLINP